MGMDWAQLVSLLPALGAMKQGGPEFDAFMQGYQQADQQLVAQGMGQQRLDMAQEQQGFERDRLLRGDARDEQAQKQATLQELMSMIPGLAEQVTAAPSVMQTEPMPFTGVTARPTFEGADPAGAVQSDLTSLASIMGAPDAAGPLAALIPPAITRAQAAKANRRRKAIRDAVALAEKRVTPEVLQQSGAQITVVLDDGSTEQIPYAEALQEAQLPPVTPTPKKVESELGNLTGEPGNRLTSKRSSWKAAHPGQPVPPELEAMWQQEAITEAEPVKAAGSPVEPGSWTDTGRLDKDGNAIYVNSKTLATKSMPFGTKPNAAAEQEKGNKRRAVVDATQRTLDAIDELLDENGKLKPATLSAVGGSRMMGLWKVPGTDAYDANAAIDRVRARLVTDLMAELKAQSRTGATGFGQLNLQELKIIQDSAAKLNPGQSEASFATELKKIRDRLEMILREPVAAAAPVTPNGTPGKVGRFEIVGIR